jgi:hypothetical protein
VAENRTDKSDYGHLIERGWQQGAVFALPGGAFAVNQLPGDDVTQLYVDIDRQVRSKERVVLVSHPCDIKSADEPSVQVMICRWFDPIKDTTRVRTTRIGRNSPRYFVVDPDGVWIAEAKYPILVDKRVLEALDPPTFQMSPERLLRFRDWLARRFDRPAVPDALFPIFHGRISEVLDQLEANEPQLMLLFNSVVNEVRATKARQTAPPFVIGVVLLTERSISAEQDDAVQQVLERISGVLDSPDLDVRAPLRYPYLDAPNEILLKSDLVGDDHLSFDDDHVVGAAPTWILAAGGESSTHGADAVEAS